MSAAVLDQTAGRLLDSAGTVFAERGFQLATVREISARAGANVAAVNYHFGDKFTLYLAVLRKASGSESPRNFQALVDRNPDPEVALRAIVRESLYRIFGIRDRQGIYARIMAHELARPSQALDRVVEEIIGPNYAALRQLLSRILGTSPDHDTTRLCAHSVIGQMMHYVHGRQVIARLWPGLELSTTFDYPATRLDQIADHIATFSIYSLRALSNSAAKQEGSTL
jgi:AcrR family transcriptional regulator